MVKKNKINILIITIFTVLYSCNKKNNQQNIDIQGNWTALYFDKYENSYIYQEIYFDLYTMTVFDSMWHLHLPAHYLIKKDSIYISNIGTDTTISAKIIYKNPDNLIFQYDSVDVDLTRIKNEGWTVDSLINTGIDNRRVDKSVKDSVYRDFIETQFWIREIRSLISHNIENRDSLISYWKRAMNDSTINDKYIYENFLREFDKN